METLSPESVKILNDFNALAQFKSTPIFERFMKCHLKVRALFAGNQGGKTCYVIRDYIFRFLSMHPVASKNFNWLVCSSKGHKYPLAFRQPETVCGYKGCDGVLKFYSDPFRKVRFASENLPMQNTTSGAAEQGGGTVIEVRNTQYPELLKWIPRHLIKKDINQRNSVMVIRDIWGGPDIVLEFVSYNQDVQAMAGVQLKSVWADEQPPKAFLEEMRMRLLATDGDLVISLTPAERLSYLFDEVYEPAAVYYRSDVICKEFGIEPVEHTESKKSIAVFQMATDDNPTLDPAAINRIFEDLDAGDPDVIAIRRYGMFRAVSSTIFKAFTFDTHLISHEKWFPHGVPDKWMHARSIDYHPVVPWAVIHVSLSDTNECFVWWENTPDPTRLTTDEIADTLARSSREYLFRIDRIDPLANVKIAKRTKDNDRTTSVREDLNDELRKLKKKGLGTGGAFLGFDTKGTRGREQIRIRLKNSKECGEPFNNERKDEHGNEYYVPTLWITDQCPKMAKSMKNWRLEVHANSSALVTKDENETPQQKWSHFPMALEGILKESAFRPRVFIPREDDRDRSLYFSGRRAGRDAEIRFRM